MYNAEEGKYLVEVVTHECPLTYFSIWVFFHEHSQFTGLQEKAEATSVTPLYHFHLLHRHLHISQVISAESSPLST